MTEMQQSLQAELGERARIIEGLAAQRDALLESPPTSAERRAAIRDLLAELIDEYMGEGGEFRAYDLTDRIQTRLANRGWWVVWGANVAQVLDGADQDVEKFRRLYAESDDQREKLIVLARDLSRSVRQYLTYTGQEPEATFGAELLETVESYLREHGWEH